MLFSVNCQSFRTKQPHSTASLFFVSSIPFCSRTGRTFLYFKHSSLPCPATVSFGGGAGCTASEGLRKKHSKALQPGFTRFPPERTGTKRGRRYLFPSRPCNAYLEIFPTPKSAPAIRQEHDPGFRQFYARLNTVILYITVCKFGKA